MEKLKAELRLLSQRFDPEPTKEETLDLFIEVLRTYFTDKGIEALGALQFRSLMRKFIISAETGGYHHALASVMQGVVVLDGVDRQPEPDLAGTDPKVVPLFNR